MKKRGVTFQTFLKDMFSKRYSKNPNYSLRAFARDLGVPSANLSSALKGTRGFSAANLDKIAKRLSLNAEETRFMKLLCEKQFSKSKKNKETAAKEIQHSIMYEVQLSEEKISLIQDWYHMAILALLDTKSSESGTDWISERLGISKTIVENAIERLIKINSIKIENGQYVSTGSFFVDPKGIPSQAIRNFHHQVLQKADQALEMQDLDKRDFASVMMTLDKRKMQDAKERIKKFREEFIRDFSITHETPELEQEVYTIALQLFQITQNRQEKGSYETI